MASTDSTYDWFNEPEVVTQWLVHGLIRADGYSSVIGKPRAGKSTFIRNLIVATIKGHTFLGREIHLPVDTGRVLYIHLDRKDDPGTVVSQLKKLGLSKQDSPRLTMQLAQHMPDGDKGFAARLTWLQRQVSVSNPHLIVIDLLWQFVIAKNSNDYNAVLGGINALQDALIDIKYKGALIVTMHGRKATNPNDQFDDILGSTGQRGSFSTNIMLSQDRNEERHTIISDQTFREPGIGEIPETILVQDAEFNLRLGQSVRELRVAEKKSKADADLERFLNFIETNPGCGMEDIIHGLRISDRRGIQLFRSSEELVYRIGTGKKGDPHRYCPIGYVIPKEEANALVN